MSINIKHEILEEIGPELKKNEAPEALYSSLEKDHWFDLSKKIGEEANKAFTSGKGEFTHTLRAYSPQEGNAYLSEPTREKEMTERLVNVALGPLLEEKPTTGLLTKFSVFRHDKQEKRETAEKTHKLDNSPKPKP